MGETLEINKILHFKLLKILQYSILKVVRMKLIMFIFRLMNTLWKDSSLLPKRSSTSSRGSAKAKWWSGCRPSPPARGGQPGQSGGQGVDPLHQLEGVSQGKVVARV